MAHLIIIHDDVADRDWRVLSDLDDRDAAIAEAEEALIARGSHASRVERVVPAAMPAPEFAPDHDLWVREDDVEPEMGALTLTVGRRDVVLLALPDGSTARIYLHDGRSRATLRVEAPTAVRVRVRKVEEVEA